MGLGSVSPRPVSCSRILLSPVSRSFHFSAGNLCCLHLVCFFPSVWASLATEVFVCFFQSASFWFHWFLYFCHCWVFGDRRILSSRPFCPYLSGITGTGLHTSRLRLYLCFCWFARLFIFLLLCVYIALFFQFKLESYSRYFLSTLPFKRYKPDCVDAGNGGLVLWRTEPSLQSPDWVFIVWSSYFSVSKSICPWTLRWLCSFIK